MKTSLPNTRCVLVVLLSLAATVSQAAGEESDLPKAYISGTGSHWSALDEDDFVNVNCDPDTWSWKDGVAHCTGTPIGVIRSKKPYTNFELVCEWRHLRPAGNSGVFVWADDAALEGLERGKLPKGGIEVQVLDNGYADQYRQKNNKEPDFFTTHGDVFAVGTAKMTPFPPVSPNGSRSFPSKELSKSSPQWNHYYVRCINGEVRLWVNGEEVSGGTGCQPSSGYLALESEGSPVEFRNIRVRELP